MATPVGKVVWHGDELLLQVNELNLDLIDKLALRVVTVSDPPVDTGFLDASAYVNSSSGLNTFDETWHSGFFTSRKSGRDERRDAIGSPEPPPKGGAVAGWAAGYAVYVEENTDFIFKALSQVASGS